MKISLWRSTISRFLTMYALVFAVLVVGLVLMNYWSSANYTATQADYNINWQFQYFSALPHNPMLEKIDARIKTGAQRAVD